MGFAINVQPLLSKRPYLRVDRPGFVNACPLTSQGSWFRGFSRFGAVVGRSQQSGMGVSVSGGEGAESIIRERVRFALFFEMAVTVLVTKTSRKLKSKPA